MDEPQTRMTEDDIASMRLAVFVHLNPVAQELWARMETILRTRSVEPPREMVEKAKEWLDKTAHNRCEVALRTDAEALADLLTSVRSQAIELCAGVAREFQVNVDDPRTAQEQLAASIRSLR